MRKLLLSMAVLALGAVSASAAEEPLYDLTFNKDNNQSGANNYTSTWQVISSGAEWNMVNFNNFNNGGGQAGQTEWTYVRCGRKGNASVATITNESAWAEKINKVVINAKKNKSGANDKVNTATLELLETPESTTAVATYTFTDEVNALTTSYGDITVNVTESAAGMYYRLTFDMPSNTNNGWLEIQEVKYYGETSLLSPEISFDKVEYQASLGSEFESPVATTVSDGAVTYSSTDEAVATVDAETGEVTLVGAGSTTITASVAETATYRAGSASYELTVIDPDVANPVWTWSKGGEEVFDFILVGDNTVNPWSYDNRYGIKGSAYISGAANATESIAATPVLDLTNYDKLTLNFRQAANMYKNNDNGGESIDVTEFPDYAIIVARVAGQTEWTEVAKATAPSAFGWGFYDNEEIDLKAYDNTKMQFGFKYISSSSVAGTWEIDNIVLKGKVASAVENIEIGETAAPVYYNMQGVRVANPENGLYIEVRGNKSRKVMIR